MSKIWIGVAAVATIATGYGAWNFLSRPVDMPPSAGKQVTWEKMADGSFVAQSGVGGFSDALTRCWSIKDGYECVHAAQMSQTIDISAGEVKTLPNDGNISGIGFEGDKLIIPDAYRCSSIGIGNPEETIVGRGNRLASTSKGWSVRRQNIWHRPWRKLAECRPRLWVDIMRRAFGVASADARWSVA